MSDIRTSALGGIPFGGNSGRPAGTTGQPYFNGEEKRLELYTSAGWQNIVSETPGVVSVSGNYLESVGSATLEITGTNFTTGAIASVIGTNGVEINANSTTVNSIVSISASFSGLVGANEPYDLKITNTSNLFGLLPDAIYVNASPVWQTASGSLGSFGEQVSISVSAVALDSDSTISYALASGSSLPSGITLNSSTGLISGTLPNISTNTTYSFVINASDGLNAVVPRSFSFISNAAPTWVTASGSLGTFSEQVEINLSVSATDPESITYSLASGSSLPSGVTLNSSTGVISGTLPDIVTSTTYTFTINASDAFSTVPREFSITSTPIVPLEYLVVGGGGSGTSNLGGGTGGGGAGGFLSGNISYSLGSSALVTVGNGGAAASGRTFGYPGQNSVFSSFTALGGGYGNCNDLGGGGPGGSGGGGGEHSDARGAGGIGTLGQGYNGGTGTGDGGTNSGGGGGGAGGPGGNGDSVNGSTPARTGGPGLPSSITGTLTYYAGGGGASGNARQGGNGGIGGGGGGGAGVSGGTNSPQGYGPGQPNTGGGGGGNHTTSTPYGGGSGVVIIAYPNTFGAATIPGTLTYNEPTRAGYRVYRFTAGTGNITI